MRRQTCGVRKSNVVVKEDRSDFLANRYIRLKELGVGAFGRVELVTDQHGEKTRVLKVVDTSNMHPTVLAITKREIQLLKSLDHPYIVKLFEFSEDSARRHELVFVLEFFECGDAMKLLNDHRGAVPEHIVGRITYQLLVALAYCHLREVVHRDVKPENMMLTRAYDGAAPDCRLIDFGLADTGSRVGTAVGTPAYMAPEVWLSSKRAAGTAGSTYTSAADLWSTGATAWQLLLGKAPFGEPSDYASTDQFWSKVSAHKSFSSLKASADPEKWNDIGVEAQEFLEKVLELDPRKRVTAHGALGNDWMEDSDTGYQQINRSLVHSIIGYAQATTLERCCAFVLAARLDHDDTQVFEHAFLHLDSDLSGVIDFEEFNDVIEKAMWGCCYDSSRAEAYFNAIDLSHTGEINYTEFVAACIYGRYSQRMQLFEEAFDVIDCDQDGEVWFEELRSVMSQGSLEILLQALPASFRSETASLDLQDWLMLMQDSVDAQQKMQAHESSRTSRELRGLTVVVEDDDESVIGSAREHSSPFAFACCASYTKRKTYKEVTGAS